MSLYYARVFPSGGLSTISFFATYKSKKRMPLQSLTQNLPKQKA